MLLYPAAFGHKSFPFNSHLNTDGTPNEDNVYTTVTIDARDVLTAYRDLREPLHLAQGGTLGRIHKGMTLIRLSGRIEAPDGPTQAAVISDRERTMMIAFDPASCLRDSPTTEGAYAFTFGEPTTDTTTFPTGRMDLCYYCRPAERPSMVEAYGEGPFRRYTLALIAPDPRAYDQYLGDVTMSSGAWTKSVVNNGTVPGPLQATIEMAGAGATNFTLTAYGTAFVLNLSALSAGNIVVVNMETCGPFGRGRRVTVNGTDAFSRKTSSASSWLVAPAGTTSFVATNTTNVTTCYLEWGHTWA